MTDARQQRAEIEARTDPVAILQAGVFAFANRAFLERVQISNLADLAIIPVLDLMPEHQQDALKKHLAQAERLRLGSGEAATAAVTMVGERGEHFDASLSSRPVEYDGERCIEITLRTREANGLVGFLRGRPWALYVSVIFIAIFLIAPVALISRLNVNNAARVYFPPDEPAVKVDDSIREKFPTDQVVVMMFEGVALFSDEFLESFDALAQDLKANPRVKDVLSVTTQDHISGTEDGFEVGPLLDVERLDESRSRERAGIVLADRFARRLLVSEDGSALTMIVIPLDADDSLQRLSLIRDIQSAVQKAELSGYVTAMAGEVPTDVAQFREMIRNNAIFIPVTVLVGLTMIWWLFHRPLAVVASGIGIGMVAGSTIALYVLFGRPFTLMSSMIPPLLSALTLASLVHLFNGIHYSAQRGLVGRSRVRSAVDEIRNPTLFAVLTTSAGLASLYFAPNPAIADFGLISAVGSALIYPVVIWIMPQIFIRWDRSPWPTHKGGLRWMDAAVRVIAHVGIRHPLWVVLIVLALLAAGAPQLRNIKVETNLQEFFPPSHELRRSTDRIDRELVGTTSLDVVFETPETDGLLDPAKLRAIKAFQQWVDTLAQVDKSVSPADFIEEMNWGFHEEQDEFRSIPDSRDLISQYVLVYDGDQLINFLDQDYRVGRVGLNLNVHKAHEIGAVIDEIRSYLERHPTPGMSSEIGGAGRLFADMEELIVMGQVNSFGGALVLIFLLMMFMWRSIPQAALTMLPNLAPILMIFSFMGMFGIWLDMATALIASVVIGIAVDDTIFLFNAFKKRMDGGMRPAAALMRTYTQAGRAVITTTIILSVQFATLTASQFTPFSKFGLLASLGFVGALMFDLVFMPALLMLIYGRKQAAPKAAKA